MKTVKIKIFIVIAILALAGVAFWFFMPRDIKTEDQRGIGVPIGGESAGISPVSEKSADMSETYTNPKYSFSFSYPKELNASEFTEGNRDIILIKDETGDGFQISITPFDESEPVTKARILKDIPDMAIANDKIISLGGASALSFKSKGESGETIEIWFARNGNLYQISALPSFEDKMDKILETMLFR